MKHAPLKMLGAAAVAAMFAAGAAAPSLAQANDGQVSFALSASVEPFCRVTANTRGDAELQAGQADLGMLSEVCNTLGGHDLIATFANVKSGRLIVGTRSAPIENGMARISYNGPSIATNRLQVVEAVATSQSQRVAISVSIQPRR